MARKESGQILFMFVSMCVVGKNPNTLNRSTMAEDIIILGGKGVLGLSFYICDMPLTLQHLITCTTSVFSQTSNVTVAVPSSFTSSMVAG